MLDHYDLAIAKAILYAQIASDGGKNESCLIKHYSSKQAISVWHKGYSVKDKYIQKAIEMIRKSDNSSFHFYVVKSPDQNGYDSTITYFEFNYENSRYQISFHTPGNWFYKRISGGSQTYKTVWDGKIGNSRKTAFKIADILLG